MGSIVLDITNAMGPYFVAFVALIVAFAGQWSAIQGGDDVEWYLAPYRWIVFGLFVLALISMGALGYTIYYLKSNIESHRDRLALQNEADIYSEVVTGREELLHRGFVATSEIQIDIEGVSIELFTKPHPFRDDDGVYGHEAALLYQEERIAYFSVFVLHSSNSWLEDSATSLLKVEGGKQTVSVERRLTDPQLRRWLADYDNYIALGMASFHGVDEASLRRNEALAMARAFNTIVALSKTRLSHVDRLHALSLGGALDPVSDQLPSSIQRPLVIFGVNASGDFNRRHIVRTVAFFLRDKNVDFTRYSRGVDNPDLLINPIAPWTYVKDGHFIERVGSEADNQMRIVDGVLK